MFWFYRNQEKVWQKQEVKQIKVGVAGGGAYSCVQNQPALNIVH